MDFVAADMSNADGSPFTSSPLSRRVWAARFLRTTAIAASNARGVKLGKPINRLAMQNGIPPIPKRLLSTI